VPGVTVTQKKKQKGKTALDKPTVERREKTIRKRTLPLPEGGFLGETQTIGQKILQCQLVGGTSRGIERKGALWRVR